MEKSLDEKISANIKFEIEHATKSKSQIAKEMGVQPAAISAYLAGTAQPTLANLSRLCSIIGCSADDILEVKHE